VVVVIEDDNAAVNVVASTSGCGPVMVKHIAKQKKAQASSSRCVVVVYESTGIREHAVRFCEKIGHEPATGALLETDWWSFRFLSHPASADDAALRAARADVVVFAMDAWGDLPEEIKQWIERWLSQRGEREGALVGLLGREESHHEMVPFREIYLRNIAHRAGMDYLSHAAPTARKAIPDSLDSFSRRAGAMTSVLDDILHADRRNIPPPL